MVQTPRQRQGNEIYAIREAAKRGKSKTEKPLLKKLKPNISIYWVCKCINKSQVRCMC
ncbi:hypothetical protein PNEG_01084 [Pneumocystis murina B123]|uniref:Uncharacterized protein n=1 Tax=Pneumocystis murina (strain B123) TaxID=1069680 RepID=M7PKF8_PNEMU|nr:hypothetical protein PNEG_01084 [Pneumocystis murina B123]EMR10939.1 hypothetical protein PNEG_01084 [Pneumocystis murina B123]